jgi:hypothetical protein
VPGHPWNKGPLPEVAAKGYGLLFQVRRAPQQWGLPDWGGGQIGAGPG